MDVSLNGVRPETRDSPPSTGTAATARPSSTRTRRRCSIRTGRVSAGPRDLNAKAEVTVGPSAGLGVAQVGRGKAPTEKTRAPERDSRLSQRPETPEVQCCATCLGLKRMLQTLSLPREMHRYWHSCTISHTPLGGHILLDKNPTTKNFFRTLQKPQKTGQI